MSMMHQSSLSSILFGNFLLLLALLVDGAQSWLVPSFGRGDHSNNHNARPHPLSHGMPRRYSGAATVSAKQSSQRLFLTVDNDETSRAIANNRTLLILGLGRTGSCIAREAAPYFDAIVGTTTSITRNRRDPPNLRRVPISNLWRQEMKKNDGKGTATQTLPPWTHIVVTIPGTEETTATTTKVNLTQLYNRLVDDMTMQQKQQQQQHDTTDCGWIGILSTTAVYGNHNGSWVDEETPCTLQHLSGDAKAQAWLNYEQSWERRCSGGEDCRDDRNNPNLTIFRCAGIYGATRSALHTVYRKGLETPNGSSNQQQQQQKASITNRIHEQDIARAVVASMMITKEKQHSTNMTAIFNLADNLPESRQVVMEYAASLLQHSNISLHKAGSTTTTTTQSTAPNARSTRRARDQKRVRNTELVQQLLDGRPLLYPTYVQGLQSILQNPEAPWWQ